MGGSLFDNSKSDIDFDVTQFLSSVRVESKPPPMSGRLLFAIDATASRQPTWDLATGLTASMYRAVADLGKLKTKLVYFRGPGECQGSGWLGLATDVMSLMRQIKCESGMTQWERVFLHSKNEHKKIKIGAIVMIGDTAEERPVEKLIDQAHNLGVLVFAFQEGADPVAARVFSAIADTTGGAYAKFDVDAAQHLGQLLRTAALFALGGVELLEARKELSNLLLLTQLKRGKT